jgi:hypothetical protein
MGEPTNWSKYSETFKLRYAEDPSIKLNKNLAWKLKNPNKFLYNSCRQRAKQAGLEFTLTPDDIVVPEVCPVLRVKMEFATKYSPSVDRIDNSKGYTKDNIVVISMLANKMKNSATPEELRLFCQNIENVLNVKS